MKRLRIIMGLFILVNLLCITACSSERNSSEGIKSVGKRQEAVGEEKKGIPIIKANDYTCEIRDTVLTKVQFANIHVENDKIEILVVNKKGTTGFEYKQCIYDMLEDEWTEPKACKWSEQLNRLGYGYCFRKDQKGNWYCICIENVREQQENRIYHFYQLCEDGTINEIRIPEEMCNDSERIYAYYFMDDGRVYSMIQAKEEYSVNISKICLFDVTTGICETTNTYPGVADSLEINNEFYSISNADECGFLVRNKESNQPIRSIFCEGQKPEGGWGRDEFTYPSVFKDEGNNVYVLLNDGIYGGYCQDEKLQCIVKKDMVSTLELAEYNQGSIPPFVSNFCRGASLNQTDFYALIAIPYDGGAYFDYKLAHIEGDDD